MGGGGEGRRRGGEGREGRKGREVECERRRVEEEGRGKVVAEEPPPLEAVGASDQITGQRRRDPSYCYA